MSLQILFFLTSQRATLDWTVQSPCPVIRLFFFLTKTSLFRLEIIPLPNLKREDFVKKKINNNKKSWLSGKESVCQCRRFKRYGFNPWVRKIPQRRKWQPNPVFLPREFHGQRSLVGYRPWGCKESDMTE